MPEAPDREWQAGEGRRRDDDHSEHEHLEPPGRRQLVVHLREDECQRDEQPEPQFGQPDPIERPVIAPRTLHFFLREDLVKHS